MKLNKNKKVCHILAGEIRFNRAKKENDTKYNLYLSWGKGVPNESAPHIGIEEK